MYKSLQLRWFLCRQLRQTWQRVIRSHRGTLLERRWRLHPVGFLLHRHKQPALWPTQRFPRPRSQGLVPIRAGCQTTRMCVRAMSTATDSVATVSIATSTLTVTTGGMSRWLVNQSGGSSARWDIEETMHRREHYFCLKWPCVFMFFSLLYLFIYNVFISLSLCTFI